MDHQRMDLAAKLLAKAQSTPYDAEAMSLMKRSCLILMRVVTDEETAGSEVHARPVLGAGRPAGPAESDWQPVGEPVPPVEHHLDVTA